MDKKWEYRVCVFCKGMFKREAFVTIQVPDGAIGICWQCKDAADLRSRRPEKDLVAKEERDG